MRIGERYMAAMAWQVTSMCLPLPLPADWEERIYAEKQSEQDTIYECIRRMRERYRDEVYTATMAPR